MEFLVQPARRVAYTLTLEIAKNIKIPNLNLLGFIVKGYKIHILRAKNKPKQGETKYGILLEDEGGVICLINNFIASAIGCIRPIKETLLGPLRRWL